MGHNLKLCQKFFLLKSVLGIRDILVRIRIPGSVPLTVGSGSGFGSGFNSGFDYFFFIGFKDAENFILQVLFQSAQHIYEKPDPYL
jgi:hypothetical protein